MLALRYVYVLALSVWFGGTIVVGVIAAPVADGLLQHFFLTSYASGGLLIASLLAMALLGPRPSEFFGRMGIAIAMYAVTLYAGLELQTLQSAVVALLAFGGLALLFWEARDGTRAA